jgi:hypothetical protein
MTIETVVFGLDDTLVAAERAYARALSVLADYHIDPTTFLAAHRRLWARYQRGDCTIEELYQGRMRDAGLTGTAAAIAHDRVTSAAAAIRWRPGARHCGRASARPPAPGGAALPCAARRLLVGPAYTCRGAWRGFYPPDSRDTNDHGFPVRTSDRVNMWSAVSPPARS